MQLVDPRDEQRARNEVLFREVNERVEEINDDLEAGGDTRMTFVCECGNTDCMEQIELERSEYEAVRADSEHFVVLPGHEDLRIARVVERHEGFFITEKLGEAAELADEQDPRA